MTTVVGGRKVSVYSHFVGVENMRLALDSRIFREWAETTDSRFSVSAITFQAIDFRGSPSQENILFLRFTAQTYKPFEEVVVLRGGTVVLLPVFICEGEKYVVFVKQPRLAVGNFELVELPAGMVDNGTFRGAAAIELEQELGIKYREDELVDLSPSGIYFSPGLLDEQGKFYTAEREVNRKELDALKGKATGVLEEGETITLQVERYEDAATVSRDAKTMVALYLYERMKK